MDQPTREERQDNINTGVQMKAIRETKTEQNQVDSRKPKSKPKSKHFTPTPDDQKSESAHLLLAFTFVDFNLLVYEGFGQSD